MPIGFGIIGCGMIAHFHARAIGDIRGAKLVACYDRIPAAADKLAEVTGCTAYHDLDAMLADPAVEVVTIGTPSGAHLEPALAAARAGKHVIVEKPLGNHPPPLRPDHRGVRQGRRGALDHLPLAVPRTERRDQAGGRAGPLRPAHRWRRHRQVVSQPGVLRQRRLARHLGTRRWRSADEPGHPQRRSSGMADGAGGRSASENGTLGPPTNRRRRRCRGHGRFCQRRDGDHRGQHGDLSRLSEADRNSRQRRFGRDGRGRHRQVGLRQAEQARRRHPPEDEPSIAAAAAGLPTQRPSATTATRGSFRTCWRPSKRAQNP